MRSLLRSTLGYVINLLKPAVAASCTPHRSTFVNLIDSRGDRSHNLSAYSGGGVSMSFRDEPGPRSLSSSLNQQLHTYGLAASTAGVALLALAAPANAEIVYTQTNREFFQGFSNI